MDFLGSKDLVLGLSVSISISASSVQTVEDLEL